MNWKVYANSARCETPFVLLSVEIDWEHTPIDNSSLVYEATVSGRMSGKPAHVDSLPSLSVAQAWAEQCYAELLRAELRSLSVGTAFDTAQAIRENTQ